VATVRPYRPDDLPAVREICVRTGYRGTDARGVVTDTALLPDIFAEPYVVYDPGLAFVADDGGTAVGYILGTADTAAFTAWFRDTWLPEIAPRHAGPPPAPDDTFENLLLRIMYDPERMLIPVLADYPAHLHIDLLPGYQGKGLGRGLMDAFRAELHRRGVPRLHLGVDPANTRAIGFYERLGFERLDLPGVYLGRSSGG
jgi:ribosomal protein S18 acetylase RimI-like enzyme